jgi:hypothetical protein
MPADSVVVPPDAQVFEMRLPDMEIPTGPGLAGQSSYRCMWIKPPAGGPYHIYSMRLLGDETLRSKVQHHLNLYTVALDTPQHPEGEVSRGARHMWAT